MVTFLSEVTLSHDGLLAVGKNALLKFKKESFMLLSGNHFTGLMQIWGSGSEYHNRRQVSCHPPSLESGSVSV